MALGFLSDTHFRCCEAQAKIGEEAIDDDHACKNGTIVPNVIVCASSKGHASALQHVLALRDARNCRGCAVARECEVGELVDEQRFEAVLERRHVLEPNEVIGNVINIEVESTKHDEQHDECWRDAVRSLCGGRDAADEESKRGRDERNEQNNQHEREVRINVRSEPDDPVDDERDDGRIDKLEGELGKCFRPVISADAIGCRRLFSKISWFLIKPNRKRAKRTAKRTSARLKRIEATNPEKALLIKMK